MNFCSVYHFSCWWPICYWWLFSFFCIIKKKPSQRVSFKKRGKMFHSFQSYFFFWVFAKIYLLHFCWRPMCYFHLEIHGIISLLSCCRVFAYYRLICILLIEYKGISMSVNMNILQKHYLINKKSISKILNYFIINITYPAKIQTYSVKLRLYICLKEWKKK